MWLATLANPGPTAGPARACQYQWLGLWVRAGDSDEAQIYPTRFRNVDHLRSRTGSGCRVTIIARNEAWRKEEKEKFTTSRWPQGFRRFPFLCIRRNPCLFNIVAWNHMQVETWSTTRLKKAGLFYAKFHFTIQSQINETSLSQVFQRYRGCCFLGGSIRSTHDWFQQQQTKVGKVGCWCL